MKRSYIVLILSVQIVIFTLIFGKENAQVFDQMLYILKRFMVLSLVKLKHYETVPWTLVAQKQFFNKRNRTFESLALSDLSTDSFVYQRHKYNTRKH